MVYKPFCRLSRYFLFCALFYSFNWVDPTIRLGFYLLCFSLSSGIPFKCRNCFLEVRNTERNHCFFDLSVSDNLTFHFGFTWPRFLAWYRARFIRFCGKFGTRKTGNSAAASLQIYLGVATASATTKIRNWRTSESREGTQGAFFRGHRIAGFCPWSQR